MQAISQKKKSKVPSGFAEMPATAQQIPFETDMYVKAFIAYSRHPFDLQYAVKGHTSIQVTASRPHILWVLERPALAKLKLLPSHALQFGILRVSLASWQSGSHSIAG